MVKIGMLLPEERMVEPAEKNYRRKSSGCGLS